MDKITLLNDLYAIYHKTADIEDFEKFKKMPQADKVWWHLSNFGSITVTICKKLYGIQYCTSAIRDIRKNLRLYGGNRFYIDSIESKGFDRWGNKTNFITYTLKGAAAV